MASGKGTSTFRDRKSHDGLTQLSKTLSWILRHGATQVGLELKPGGFLYLSDIMKLPQLSRFTVHDVEAVVQNVDKKKRFHLTTDEETGEVKIRANQGHSIEVTDLDLMPVLDSSEFPKVIHGTNMEAWRLISTQGLKKMNRMHIHFAIGEPGEPGVISGMRSTASVMVYLDLPKALDAGIKFFKSVNNAILTSGMEGVIPPCFFLKVIQRPSGNVLLFNKNASENDNTENRLVTAEEVSDEYDRPRRKKHSTRKQ